MKLNKWNDKNWKNGSFNWLSKYYNDYKSIINQFKFKC